MLSDSKLLDKFHVVNRIRSRVGETFDMAQIRSTFFRVQDYFQEMEQFILEKYHIPSNY